MAALPLGEGHRNRQLLVPAAHDHRDGGARREVAQDVRVVLEGRTTDGTLSGTIVPGTVGSRLGEPRSAELIRTRTRVS